MVNYLSKNCQILQILLITVALKRMDEVLWIYKEYLTFFLALLNTKSNF